MKLAAIWQCGLIMTEERLRLNESRLTLRTKGAEVESGANLPAKRAMAERAKRRIDRQDTSALRCVRKHRRKLRD